MDQGSSLAEVIIVDDHSTDDSTEVLESLRQKHPGLIHVFTNPEKGGNTARNFGFAQSKGDFIQWLDSDDLILPGKFDAQLAFLLDHPETAIVYSDFCQDVYDPDGNFIRRETTVKAAYEDYLLELIQDNWAPNHGYLMRRDAAQFLHDRKGWNPETRVLQDREYFTTAAIHGFRFDYVPGLFAVYNRFQQASVSASKLNIRNESVYKLSHYFKSEIQKQKEIPAEKKKTYFAILDTLILFACAWTPSLKIKEKPAFGSIQWWQVQGIRTRLKMLLTWLQA
jgi:glycosyltransferase involved in cell wall biosynthesis